MVWESCGYNVSYTKVVAVENTMEVSVYQEEVSMALEFSLAVVYALVVVGMLWVLEWGSIGTCMGPVLVIVLGVGGFLVHLYGFWDVDVVWKCLINENGTMVAY